MGNGRFGVQKFIPETGHEGTAPGQQRRLQGSGRRREETFGRASAFIITSEIRLHDVWREHTRGYLCSPLSGSYLCSPSAWQGSRAPWGEDTGSTAGPLRGMGLAPWALASGSGLSDVGSLGDPKACPTACLLVMCRGCNYQGRNEG